MKKVFKSRILLVIVTVILTGSISVYAAHKYAASNITYKDTTLDQALNTLYTTQNTTVNNLNSQITTKDATISDLQTQLNGISTTDCIRGTATLSSACATSSGCLIEDKFAPTFGIITQTTWPNYKFVVGFDKKIGNYSFGAYANGDKWVDSFSQLFNISGNRLYLRNTWDDLQSGTVTYVVCR